MFKTLTMALIPMKKKLCTSLICKSDRHTSFSTCTVIEVAVVEATRTVTKSTNQVPLLLSMTREEESM